MMRRTVLKNAMGATLMLLLGETVAQVSNAAKLAAPAAPAAPVKPHRGRFRQRNIKIHAQKFAYSPNHITLNQGDKVVLELTASDFTHGFSIPDWNLRSDIPPGQITLLTVTPEQAGDFVFLCDNFCGEGHEKMQGKITVIAKT